MVSQVASEVASAVIIALFLGIVGWALARCWRTVLIGQEGILTLNGHYFRTIGPGRRFVNPHFGFVVLPAGTAKRFHVGEAGVVTSPIGGRSLPGRVRVGTTDLVATAWRALPAGTRVEISTVIPPGTVWVARSREGSRSSHAGTYNPLP
jgi:hypothetical protein